MRGRALHIIFLGYACLLPCINFIEHKVSKEREDKKLDDLEMKIPCNPINQPLYAKFKIVPVSKLISNSNSKNSSSGSVSSDGNYVQV